MPAIKDFFNRIRNAVLGKKEVPMLDVGRKKDKMLSANLNAQNMEYFENPLNFNDYCKDFFSVPGNFDNQYDYVELITMMQENGAMQEYQGYLNYVKNNPSLYYPSQVHGVDHTGRVVLFAEMLCMLDNLSPNEKNLVMVAAQLHDIGREDDGKNFDHGFASKYKIEQMGLLRNFSDRDRDIIEFAVESHSLEPEQIQEKLKQLPRKDRKDYKKILDYLQDADKLDRTRIANPGWGLDPNRLASDTAKRLVKAAHQNYYEYHNMMRYQEKASEQDLYGNKLTLYLDLVRQKGFNITLEDFSNIVSEYKPGTLEMLYGQGKLEDIFSYDTFQKYRKEESFEESLKPDRIDPNQLFADVTKRQQIELLRSSFDMNFMLYYNLKKNNPEAYNLMCYVDLDMNDAALAGVVGVIKLNDLEKLNRNGHFFRMNDLVELASKVTPEEYIEIVNSGKIEDLYSSKYCKNQDEIKWVRENLQSKGINIDEDTFHANFRLIQELSYGRSDILTLPGIENYSLPEIYGASTKLRDAKFRIRDGKSSDFYYDSKTILELLEYTKNVKLPKELSEEDMLDMAEQFAKNPSYVKDPRYVEYKIKRNRPIAAQNIEDMVNYKKFCAEQVLLDQHIDLEHAKRTMINALFSIDVPSSYQQRFENEILQSLYYHQKYLPTSDLETNHKYAMDAIRSLFTSKNIADFKNVLYENIGLINSYNTAQVGHIMQYEIAQFSRQDMVSELRDTAMMIQGMPNYSVIATNGMPVQAKVLSGEEFCIATSTSMPRCSGRTNKMLIESNGNRDKFRNDVYSAMLNTQVLPNEICTSITNNEMLAHASSALQDQELIFGYVPLNPDDISIAAMYDLSTTKNKSGVRTTQSPTTPRSMKDFVGGTTEEHNEAVMSNVYPRYIVCYDQITDVAIAKRDALEQEYRSKGIMQPIEILFIDAKGKYLPQIKSKIEQEHSSIMQKLNSGQFTYQDFADMFERNESNFALRTLQAIHSTSYRDDTWDERYNDNLLRSMTDILEKVAQIVPPEKARVVEEQISTLIERSDRKSAYGSRFYDHSYAETIDSYRLENIRDGLLQRINPYERSQTLPVNEPQAKKAEFEDQNYGGR